MYRKVNLLLPRILHDTAQPRIWTPAVTWRKEKQAYAETEDVLVIPETVR